MGRRRSVVSVLLLTASILVAVGSPATAADDVAVDEGSSRAAMTTPLLEAVALMPPDSETFEFLDWAALKALYGGAEVTSASPLTDRQRLLLDIARSEASPMPLGLDRLEPWRERWGWDTTDLAWQAAVPPFVSILRFRDGWDRDVFIDRLVGYGYSRIDRHEATVFVPGRDAAPPSDARLERVFGEQRRISEEPVVNPVSVALPPDGRTVVLARGDWAESTLAELAADVDPAVATSPFAQVASALGRPLAARILDGQYGCSGTGEEQVFLSEDGLALARAVGPLDAYRAFGGGYVRSGQREPATGRYVFAYEHAEQAEGDRAGRQRLLSEGGSSLRGSGGIRPRSVSAWTDGPALVLDVALTTDAQQVLDLTIGPPLLFAVCG